MTANKSIGVGCARALAAAGVLALVNAPMLAQAQSKPPAKAAEQNARTAPAAAQSPPAAAATQPGDTPGWAVSCAGAGRGGALNCAAEQKIIAQETGQTISGVSVRIPGDTRQPVVVFLFPFGLYLPAGLKAQVDQGAAIDLAVQTCEPTGCFATAPSPASLLASMAGGKTLEVRGVTMGKEPFRVTHPLNGFKAALDAIK